LFLALADLFDVGESATPFRLSCSVLQTLSFLAGAPGRKFFFSLLTQLLPDDRNFFFPRAFHFSVGNSLFPALTRFCFLLRNHGDPLLRPPSGMIARPPFLLFPPHSSSDFLSCTSPLPPDKVAEPVFGAFATLAL